MRYAKKQPWYLTRMFFGALAAIWVLIVPIITGIALILKRIHTKDEIEKK